VTIKGSTARSASFCLLVGAASRDAPDLVDAPKPSLGNGNWEQTLLGVQKYSILNTERTVNFHVIILLISCPRSSNSPTLFSHEIASPRSESRQRASTDNISVPCHIDTAQLRRDMYEDHDNFTDPYHTFPEGRPETKAVENSMPWLSTWAVGNSGE
jgi:hypothetical protein